MTTGDGSDQAATGPLSITEGARFGDLTLVRKLGQGAQGVVFEGLQESVGRRVAVKILPKEVAFTQEQIDRFQREAEAEGRLNHPNIVAVYGFQEVHGHHLILQELVDGGNLEDVLDERTKQGTRTTGQDCTWAAGMCRQVAEALEHAHQHNVVHRDIKPGNVMLTTNGAPKLTDFGLAKVEDMLGLSTTGAVMGTPYYMSPEQVAAKKDGVDARTDVYSLGVLLYKMITQVLPFQADSMQAIFLDILTRAPKPPRRIEPGVHPDLEAVCLKAMEKDPADRYQSAQELADDLQRYLDGESTLARPVSFAGRAIRAVRRQATSTLAILPLLVITVWFALDRLGLEPLTVGDPDLHWVRLGMVGLVVILAGWPLSLLAVRLARARRWAAAPAWGLALALGAAAGWFIREEHVDQLHTADRARLAQGLMEAQRRDVDDVQAHIDRWSDRFGPRDHLLVARMLLARKRPTEAEPWARRLGEEEEPTPVHHALMSALFEALGDVQQAEESETRLWTGDLAVAGWEDWQQAGHILRDIGRHADARQAYEKAARLQNADRDALNLMLAQASQGLCQWDSAAEYLEDFRKWNESDPSGLLLALIIAKKEGRWSEAEELLARYEADPSVPPSAKVVAHFNYLKERAMDDQANTFVRQSFERHGGDPTVVAWCGETLLKSGMDQAMYSVWYSRNDRESEAREARRQARIHLDEARNYFEHLQEITPDDSFLHHNGLCAVETAYADADPENRTQHLQRAMAEAEKAIELDPLFYEAHYNRGIAAKKLAEHEHGVTGTLELPPEAIEAYLGGWRRSLELNGLQPEVLNDTADTLNRVYDLTGDASVLDEAFDYVTRALRQKYAALDGDCTPGNVQRRHLSSFHDTLASCRERAGDLQAALAAALDSRAILQGGDEAVVGATREKRTRNIERLRALIASDG